MSNYDRNKVLANYDRNPPEIKESIVDDALEKLTTEGMKEAMNKYQLNLGMENVEKMIELEVSKTISPWIPEKYTEVDVRAWIGDFFSTILTEFMTDGKTMMVVAHEATNPVEKYYDPTSLTEDFFFTYTGTGRGSKVETLPEVAKTNHLGLVNKPRIAWNEISSVNMESAQAPFDAKGTSGWATESYAISDYGFSYQAGYDDVHIEIDNTIEFSLDDLDELVDLLNDVQSEVMKFK